MAEATIDITTYIDDSMGSVRSERQGTQLYHQLSALLSKAGMHARKWLSNSSEVLGEIPLEDMKAEVDLEHSQLLCAKTLGVRSCADTDVFTFKETVPEEDITYTKRILRPERFFGSLHNSCKNAARRYVDHWHRFG